MKKRKPPVGRIIFPNGSEVVFCEVSRDQALHGTTTENLFTWDGKKDSEDE